MAEETKTVSSGDPVVEETQTPEGETPEQKQNPEEKKFVQKDVDQIVKNRLASKNKEITDLKQTWEVEKTEYQKQLESYEKIIQEYISSQSEGFDETTRKLLQKLSIADQIEFLNENLKTQKKENAKIPGTPKPSGENSNGYTKVKKFI